jgi:L-alanine-DL-glutamate epimerase-like enolase superfamily enzyme
METSGDRISAIDVSVVKIDTERSRSNVFPGTTYYLSDPGYVYSTRFEQAMVKVETASGRHGWGEVQAPVVPEVAATLIERLLGPMLLGRDPRDVESVWETMYESMNVRGHFLGFMIDAMAGIDIALWDLKGKLLGESIATLLGGRRRETLSAYVTGPGDRANEFLDAGFEGVKKGFVRDVEDVLELGLDFGEHDPDSVYVDHHWTFDSAAEAVRLGRELEDLGVGFVEAPLPPEDIDGAARVCDSLDIPVALGESLRTTHDFDVRLERDALDIAQPDINRTGLTEGKRIATLADTRGRPVAPHIGGSLGIAMAATWHLSSAIPNFLVQEHQHERFEASNEFLTPGLDVHDGELVVPGGPGLGIDVDESALATHVTDTYSVREQ